MHGLVLLCHLPLQAGTLEIGLCGNSAALLDDVGEAGILLGQTVNAHEGGFALYGDMLLLVVSG